MAIVDRETQYWRTMQARHKVAANVLIQLLASQGDRCKICKRKGQPKYKNERLQLDHCHKTGKIRAFLCRRCNKRVGQIERGCGEANAKAARYDRRPYLQYIEDESNG